MKKLVILMLVLGLASVSFGAWSNIGLVLSGTTATISGIAGDSTVYGIYAGAVGVSSAPLTITPDGGSGNNAGLLAAISTYNAGGYYGVQITSGDSLAQDAVDTGDWFTFQWSGAVGDVFSIYDATVQGSPLLGTTVLQPIPEPMTLGLLGLGGLIMRRRKK